MGNTPPSDEWKFVDRGKGKRLLSQLLNRRTLMMAFKILSLAVRLARFLKDLFDGV